MAATTRGGSRGACQVAAAAGLAALQQQQEEARMGLEASAGSGRGHDFDCS